MPFGDVEAVAELGQHSGRDQLVDLVVFDKQQATAAHGDRSAMSVGAGSGSGELGTDDR